MNLPAGIVIEALADDAWLLRLGDTLDQRINTRVHALVARINAEAPAWLRDVVPAYASLAVFFEPQRVRPGQVRSWLCDLVGQATSDLPPATGRRVEIPVAYGGEHGPDLAAAADELGISPDQLAERHADGDYTVAMIGFAPGFPYLFGLDPALALPRLATPRVHVPAGSVGVAGGQTGIYPRESPGGWRLLGRTPLRLFDPGSEPPGVLQPGDRVRFVAIDAAEYAALAGRGR
ncbi:5-oxoprolinase subunit PxpB [Lysobacter sp. F6437]|uniref:5-oxoprolinase subunit PxpB n=1 Tax=Lysobacter sp. F6437 TaxID=3459296 RepID=UPI00403E25BA